MQGTIAVNNLGSHSVGGFTENFNKGKYTFFLLILPYGLRKHSKEKTYQSSVEELLHGVKADLVFNRLTF